MKLHFARNVKRLCAIAALVAGDLDFIRADVLLSTDFNSNDGGFTVTTPLSYDGPWLYDSGSGSWRQAGQATENLHANTSMLNSPVVTLPTAANVSLRFSHRFSFESDGLNWDGGQVRMSLNGGAYATVPGTSFSQNGYNGSIVGSSLSVLAGQQAFVQTSPDFILLTSIVNLGDFNANDTISIQFLAGNDNNFRGPRQPSWEIDNFLLSSTPIPEAAGVAGPAVLSIVAAYGIQCFRRQRTS